MGQWLRAGDLARTNQQTEKWDEQVEAGVFPASLKP